MDSACTNDPECGEGHCIDGQCSCPELVSVSIRNFHCHSEIREEQHSEMNCNRETGVKITGATKTLGTTHLKSGQHFLC